MFAGHLGAAFAVGRLERRLNVGVLAAAALLPDMLLWSLVLLGWESASVPPDFARTHQLAFVFPYSHGLATTLGWSLLAAGLTFAVSRRLSGARTALLVGAAVASHWVLDALVHQPVLPLLGRSSPAIGLALWDNLAVALAVEAAIVAAGVALFVRGSRLPRARKVAFVALAAGVLALTVAGMTVAPPAPSAHALAASSLAATVASCALVAWLAAAPAGSAVNRAAS